MSSRKPKSRLQNLFPSNDLPLTRESLGEFLSIVFPNYEIIYNKKFSDLKFKVDYRIEELKLIVEFEDPKHFTQPELIVRDEMTQMSISHREYDIIRIPYFIQLNTEMVKYYFLKYINHIDLSKLIINDFTSYPHGFIDAKQILPAAFCAMGQLRYEWHLSQVPHSIHADMDYSLIVRMADRGSVAEVFNLSDPWSFEFLADMFFVDSSILDSLPNDYIELLRDEFEWMSYYYGHDIDHWKSHNLIGHSDEESGPIIYN